MYTKHNGDNAKLRIFSFIPQRQRIQPNFMNHTYQTTKHTNTTQTTKTTTSTFVSPLTQSLCSYNLGNENSRVFIFTLCNKSANLVHFMHHLFVQFIDPEKLVPGLMNNFVHSIHPYINPLPATGSCRDGWNVRNRSNVPEILNSGGEKVNCVLLLVLVVLLSKHICNLILNKKHLRVFVGESTWICWC